MTASKNASSVKAQATLDLMIEAIQLAQRLRALGKKHGAVTIWGGGLWGLLRSLHQQGPQTVPMLARSRPVARQRVQRLANEMVEAGLVVFIDNPHHRRSKLLTLSAKGRATLAMLDARLVKLAGRLSGELPTRDISRALATLRSIARSIPDR